MTWEFDMSETQKREKKRKYRPPISGMANLLNVMYGDDIVGHGFMLFYDGMFFPPIISNFEGKELEPKWYQLYTYEQRLVVVSRTIQ